MKLFNKIRSLGRKSKIAVAGVALIAVAAVPFAVNAEFYPARPTYDYAKYNGNNDCNDANNIAAKNGRCGSMSGPVFNSFVNTPEYGDERAFFDGRRSDKPTNTNADTITEVDKGSKEVVLRMYVHNNANESTNASGKGVAKNTKVRIALPSATEQVLRARAYITADNAAGVEDTTDLTSSEKFNVSYVPGSAKLLRGTATHALSDNIVTTGALIGDKTMNGNLPGCFDYAALVEIKVKINVAPTPDLQLVKEVKVKGTTGWNKEISTKPGTEIQWRLTTKNISNATLDKVNVRDVLPPHLALVQNSVRMIDATQDTVQNDAPLFGGGLGLGTYPSGGIRYIIFNTTTKDDFSGCSVRLRNLAYAKSTQTPNEDQDSSVVNITKENCNPVTPSYSCDALTATRIGTGREYKFTANASNAGGATIQRYIFSFGDGMTQKSATNSVNYSYAKDGKYSAAVQVEFLVNGQTVTQGGNGACAVQLNVDTVVPAYVCDTLTTEKLNGRTVRFNAKASAINGATIQNYTYNFGDGSAVLTSTNDLITYTYDKDGSYKPEVKVNVLVNGQTVTVSGANCVASLEFSTVNPTYSCDLVTIEKTGERNVNVKAKASANNGATIKRYVYNFGDGSAELTTDKTEVTHSYAKDGQYAVRVKVQIGVGNETVTAESNACAAAVTFASTPTTPTTPGKLPETGAGSVIATFLAVTGVSTLGYYLLARRSARI